MSVQRYCYCSKCHSEGQMSNLTTKSVCPNCGSNDMQIYDRPKDRRKMGLHTTPETITPKLAETYLQHNKTNRRLRSGWVILLARSIKTGTYILTHQGIAFDVEGNLIDGQHRLHAIMMAKQPVVMNVTRHLPHESGAYIDRGKVRSLRDNAVFIEGLGPVSSCLAATAKRLLAGADHRAILRYTREEVLATLEKYRDSIDYAGLAGSACPAKIRTASVRAAIARAHSNITNGTPTELPRGYTLKRLSRFVELLATGVPPDGATQPGDATPLRLRTRLLISTQGSESDRIAIYQKTERALDAFLRGIDLTKIYAQSEEQFPIPEDSERAFGHEALFEKN